MVKALKGEQDRTGIKLLWGTANLFGNKRYMHGAATSPNLDAFAYAGGAGQEGDGGHARIEGGGVTPSGEVARATRPSWNTDMKRELDHLGAFLQMAVDYKRQIGFKGPFYIEPKPMEPTKHQYDSDTESCLNFLRTYGLLPHFKLNLETNHATLAGHEMEHELRMAMAAGALGSIDANTGDPMVGWDTDQFPDGHLPDHEVHAGDPRHGRLHHRRGELRRQGQEGIVRADRPLPRAHRRDGRLRARSEDRRRDPHRTAGSPRS